MVVIFLANAIWLLLWTLNAVHCECYDLKLHTLTLTQSFIWFSPFSEIAGGRHVLDLYKRHIGLYLCIDFLSTLCSNLRTMLSWPFAILKQFAILDDREKKTIFKIKKVMDSDFLLAIGKKSILSWNTVIDFNLNEWVRFWFLFAIYFCRTNTWVATFFWGFLVNWLKQIIFDDL